MVTKDLIPEHLSVEARELTAGFIELEKKVCGLIQRTPTGPVRDALTEAEIHCLEAAAKLHLICRPTPSPFRR